MSTQPTPPVDFSSTEPARPVELARLERAYAMLPWLAKSTRREGELEELLVAALALCKEMQQHQGPTGHSY